MESEAIYLQENNVRIELEDTQLVSSAELMGSVMWRGDPTRLITEVFCVDGCDRRAEEIQFMGFLFLFYLELTETLTFELCNTEQIISTL